MFFFFNDTATTEIYTLSLHDALPILRRLRTLSSGASISSRATLMRASGVRSSCETLDRKSTRLNSSHLVISYAVFCLKKKNNFDRRVRKRRQLHSLQHSVASVYSMAL